MPKINFKDMTFFEAKQLAKLTSGKTNEEIAEEIGVGHEHVAKHFREPKYNISAALLPKLCRALGNDIQIEWQCIQAGGHFSRVDRTKPEETDLAIQISQVCRESADVLQTYSQAMLDKSIDQDKRSRIDKELCDLIRKAEECREVLSMKTGRA